MNPPGDWYVVDMDDGIVRRESSKKACLEWAIDRLAISRNILPGAKKMHDGFYEYFIGPGREDATQVWIAKGSVAAVSGFDLRQRPPFPQPERPGERVDRDDE